MCSRTCTIPGIEGIREASSGAHAHASHTAIAIRPASAIRYAVMAASFAGNQINVRQTAVAIVSGANPIPPDAIRLRSAAAGPRADVDLPRRVPARSRAPAISKSARTATRFATPCDNALDGRMVRPEIRVAVRLKKPAAGFPGAGFGIFDVGIMQVFCPTGQELFFETMVASGRSADHANGGLGPFAFSAARVW
jgi:hypothetical protein